MPPEELCPSRRAVLAGVAVTAVSLPVLQNLTGSQAFADGPTTAPAGGSGWIATVKANDLVDDAFAPVKGFEKTIVLARDGQNIYALKPKCTHKGCPVSASDAAHPSVLVCKCHGSRFDISGAAVRKPATVDLSRYPIRLSKAGLVEVDNSRVVDSDDKDSTLVLPQ